MQIIRSAEALARALDSPLDPELLALLRDHADRIAAHPDFTFEELAVVLIVPLGQRLSAGSPVRIEKGRFSHLPEYVRRHLHWLEAVFVTNDDGSGVIVLVEQGEGADPDLIAACEGELI